MCQPEDDLYSYHRPSYPSYADVQRARAREYHRRQQEALAARQAELEAIHSRRAALERYRLQKRQEQLRLNEERRRKERAMYLAELERRGLLDTFLRAQQLGYDWDDEEEEGWE